MQNEMIKLLDTIKADYANWMTRCTKGDELSNHQKDMIVDFNLGLEFKEGKKYIKVISNRSVWGFVVKNDTDKKFRKGDILKAAGYNAPARNAARGNVFEDYSVAWTGPHYLK